MEDVRPTMDSLVSSSQLPDSQPTASQESPQSKELRTKFMALCAKLNADEATQKNAWQILMEVPKDQQPAQWIPYALHVACRTEDRYSLALSTVLRVVDIRIADFFEKMKVFLSIVSLSDEHEEHLLQLKRKWIVLTCLYYKYEKMYAELLKMPTDAERRPNYRGDRSEQYLVFSFGWLLFLVVKGRLLPGNSIDFVNTYHMLLCCMNFVFVHAPESHRLVSLQDPSIIASNAASIALLREEDVIVQPVAAPQGKNNLPYLCTIFKANYSEVLEVQSRLFGPFAKLFGKTKILRYDEVPRDDVLYFDNLLEREYLARNRIGMNKEYELMYYASGDLDERLFIDHMEQIGTPSKIQTQYYQNRSLPDHMILSSPWKGMQTDPVGPQAAISSTIDHVSWLQQTLTSRPEDPSVNLTRYFKVASADMRDNIENRIKSLTEKVRVTGFIEMGRLTLASKLYYKVLEHMLKTEEARLKQDNFTTLLSQDNFHTSLFACCLDVVASAYQIEKLQFPYFLRLFKIEPFHYTKIIENVVRNEPELPKTIVRHLVQTEEMIVEQLGWEEGSPVYSLLPSSTTDLLSLYNHLTSGNSAPNKREHAMAALASPMKTKTEPATPGRRAPFSHSLDLFYRKTAHVASNRARDLCNKLKLSNQTYSQVWQATLHVIVFQSHLIKGRHLDQIIMCSLYGVSKVTSSANMTFRLIIDQYRHQSQCNPKVFREIIMDSSDNKKDIIAYYNTYFIPIMEKVLREFPQNTRTEVDDVPAPLQSPTKLNANVYLSPMKQRTNHPTPNRNQAGDIYSVGESPAKGLHMINMKVNSPKVSRPRKRLNFDAEDAPTPLKKKFEDFENSQ